MLDLQEIPFFSKLSGDDLDAVRDMIVVRSFAPGAIICRKGDIGRFFYAIASGGVKVHLLPEWHAHQGNLFLGPGHIFGEMSLITDTPVSATVVAEKETCTYVLPKETFFHILETKPRLYESLAELLVERIRHRSNLTPSANKPSCAIIVIPLAQFRILGRLVFHGVIHYAPNSYYIDAALDEGENSSLDGLVIDRNPPDFFPPTDRCAYRFTTGPKPHANEFAVRASYIWLKELIERWRTSGSIGQCLVLAIAAHQTVHLKQCLHAGDAALVFATPRKDRLVGDILEARFGMADLSVVRLDGDKYRAEGRTGRRWSFTLPSAEVEAARKDVQAFVQEPHNFPQLHWIARWITSREIGIALGAGAARGLAHLGVLQVLEEAGIPVDCAYGTSMGGIVALLYAKSGNAQRAVELARELFSANKKLRDIAWIPKSSLLLGKKIHKVAYKAFGDTTFAELSKPAAVVAADLVRGEPVVFDEGPIAEALLATCAMPGIFPPVFVAGRVLVDGGLLSRIPLDLLRRRRCGLRIAVNAAPLPIGNQENWDHAPWFEKRLRRILGIRKVIVTSWDLLAWWHGTREAEQADIFIEPLTQRYSAYRLDSIDQMIEAGRRAAEDKLSAIRTAVSMALRPGSP